ncbi:MAG TPA: RIP metalloprotease RseP [Bacteroidales bacterium]|nr:RIP metalloprotease RseP [Bacteroidales bacterium]HQQ20641.1 RIP metalloprotease RseP [Bacteroidales bacterium]
MGITTQIIGLIASLGILVFIHELGHFVFARIFKTRVEKFYLFFNIGFSIVRMKTVNGKREFSFFSKSAPESWKEDPETTEWGIGWLPLGGYCSIAGMVDETKSADQLSEEPQPWEFRSKKTWQRFLIIIGGVLFNFISAILIYILMFYHWGETYIPLDNAKYGYQFTEVAQKVGFKNGDEILLVDQNKPFDLADFSKQLLIDDVKSVTVLRNGEKVEIAIPKDFGKQVVGEGKGMFCTYQFPFVVEQVIEGMPAQKGGLMAHDSVISVNGVEQLSYYNYVDSFKQNPQKQLILGVMRGNQLVELTVTPNEEGMVGVYPVNPAQFLQSETTYYTFWKSIPRGLNQGVKNLSMYVKQFKLVFTKEGATQIGGFGAIGKLFPKAWDWYIFWNNTALLAIILAFMNILPIPALDGGYILFILVEMVTGRKPSDKFLGYANTVGFILLIALLLYANGMDVIRGFFR